MKLDLVKFMRSFDIVDDAIAAVKDRYLIHVNVHGEYPNLLQFKYDQIKSPNKSKLVRECRGIILDSSDNWNVVAFPFERFFNNGEHRAAKIDWTSASIWEKIDGSLMFMYWYGDQWNVASSGLPDARGEVINGGLTFKELFWNTWNNLEYELPTNISMTYIFELSTPDNVIVVPQKESKITFIGARDNISCSEISIDDNVFSFNWEKPTRFNIKSKDEAIAKCLKMNPMEQEGFVVVDDKFNRIKMKSPQYAAIAHLGLTIEEVVEKGLDVDKYDESLQQKWMLKIILINECDEFLSYYPQYNHMYKWVYSRYFLVLVQMDLMYNEIKGITNQFEYAQKVKGHPLSGIFFQLKAGRIESVKEGLRNTDVKKLLTILKGLS